MKILVIGIGMYVTGRHTSGYGTIFPAIIEFQRINKIKNLEVIFVGKGFSNLKFSKTKVFKALKISGLKIKTAFYTAKDNYMAILKKEKNLKCAIVTVPDHLHFKVVNECLNYNLHTLVVKPFTTKFIEAKKLILKKNIKKLYGLVEFHKRFDKHNLILKDSYANHKLGNPLYFNVEYSQKKLYQKKYLEIGQTKQTYFST